MSPLLSGTTTMLPGALDASLAPGQIDDLGNTDSGVGTPSSTHGRYFAMVSQAARGARDRVTHAMKGIWNPEVVRKPTKDGSEGAIIGPPSQYIFSNGKDPFSGKSALKVLAWGAGAYFLLKTGIHNEGDLALAYLDSTFDSVVDVAEGNLHEPTAFNGWATLPACDDKVTVEMIGDECYVRGGDYVINAKYDPYLDRVFDVHIDGYPVTDLAALQTLGERQAESLDFDGFDRKTAAILMNLTILILGNLSMAFAYRDMVGRGKDGNKLPPLSLSRMALWQTSYLLATVLYNTLGNNAGFFQYSDFPGANSNFWDHWLNWDWRGPNIGRLVSYWGTFGINSIAFAAAVEFSAQAADVLQYRLGKALPGLFTAVADRQENGVTIPGYVFVNSEVRANSKAEGDAMIAGEHNPNFGPVGRGLSNLAFGLVLAGLGGLGIAGAYDLATDETVNPLVADNPVLDGMLAGVAGVIGAAILASVVDKSGKVKQGFGTARTVMASLFTPSRLGYWFGSYLVTATAGNFALGIFSSAMQGFVITPAVISNQLWSNLIGPPWVNRIFFGTYNAIKGEPGSKFLMFGAGFLTVLGWYAADLLTEQTVSLTAEPVAIEYSVTNDPQRKQELAGEVTVLKTLLESALARPDLPEKQRKFAAAELARIKAMEVKYMQGQDSETSASGG